VATIAERNVTSSPPSTAIVFASLNVPTPWTHSTPFALNRPATPVVEGRLPHLDPELREALLRLLERERGLHPRLGGNAPHAQAGAAEVGLLLDAGNLRAELRGADGGAVAAGAASEDGDVNFHCSSPSRVRRRGG